MKTRRALVGAVVLGSLVFAACGDKKDSTDTTVPAATESTAAADGITVENAWARTSPAATTMGAAYLDITSAAADTLVGITVDASIAKEAQMHEMVMAGGMTESSMAGSGGMSETTMAGSGAMVMQQVDKIDLPAGSTVQLKPGGYHIMLIDLVKPLVLDQTFDLTLTFGSGTTKTVTVTVRDAAP